MQINVSQLLRESIGSTREYEVSGAVDAGEAGGCTVQGKCRLLRTQRSILVKCVLGAETELCCSRCLGMYRQGLKVNFEEEFFPTVDAGTGVPLPLPEDAGSFTIDEHHILDLREAIRQYCLLAVPMKPLCDENCAGLCPTCGRNLNQGPCDCPARDIDSRWSALTKLL